MHSALRAVDHDLVGGGAAAERGAAQHLRMDAALEAAASASAAVVASARAALNADQLLLFSQQQLIRIQHSASGSEALRATGHIMSSFSSGPQLLVQLQHENFIVFVVACTTKTRKFSLLAIESRIPEEQPRSLPIGLDRGNFPFVAAIDLVASKLLAHASKLVVQLLTHVERTHRRVPEAERQRRLRPHAARAAPRPLRQRALRPRGRRARDCAPGPGPSSQT